MKDVVKELSNFDFKHVVTSAYLRCLQTTGIIVAEMLPGIERVEVDLSLGEVKFSCHHSSQLLSKLLLSEVYTLIPTTRVNFASKL